MTIAKLSERVVRAAMRWRKARRKIDFTGTASDNEWNVIDRALDNLNKACDTLTRAEQARKRRKR